MNNLDIVDEMNERDDKKIGFIGKAIVYDEEVYINTFTGYGFERVIKKMGSYIHWYSSKIRLSGFEREDVKQFIILVLLDGIRRYNPELNIKLSTFLYVHIKNRVISRIKEETRQSSNATYNEGLCKIICRCGHSSTTTNNNTQNIVCSYCKIKIDNTWIVRPEHNEPLSLDSILAAPEEIKNYKILSYHQNRSMPNFIANVDCSENVENKLDFINTFNCEDTTTRKIAELMYFNDYSITDAAKEVGLSCWSASLRLKRLKNKQHIKEHFLNK